MTQKRMLFILLFWTPITAEFETMKKHTATAWANTRVETVKVPATPPVCTEAKGHVHCPRALLVGNMLPSENKQELLHSSLKSEVIVWKVYRDVFVVQ